MEAISLVRCSPRRLASRYSIPVFDSLFFGWSDMYYGQRFLSTMILTVFMMLTFLGLGIWAGQKLTKTLTQYYEYYQILLGQERFVDPTAVDWSASRQSNQTQTLSLH
jgi:hypothetical protein